MSSFSLHIEKQDPTVRASEALLDAAAIGRIQALREAIAQGGNPNHMRMDISPCLVATSSDHLECVKLIIDAGGGADQPNRFGWTALHEAAIKEDTAFLETILASEFEQSFITRDRHGHTALRAAIDAGRPEAVSMLLEADPSLLDIVDLESVSPIMAAAKARNSFLVEVLLAHNPDLTVLDIDGANIANYVEGWPEGSRLLEGHDLSAAPVRKPATIAQEELAAKEPEPEQPQAPANPFGLGGMGKMRKGP